MLKKFRTVFTLLLVFGLSAALIGDESEMTQYFPGTLGSYWVYVDQDGNELTRRVIESEEIAGETYHVFDYEPALGNSIDYDYHIHPDLYRVGEEGIAFLVGKEAKKALQARFVKEMGTLLKTMKEAAPPGAEAGFNLLYEVEAEAREQFYMLSTFTTINQKWDAMQMKAKLTITPDPPQGDPDDIAFDFTINEKGKVIGMENIETPAGTFENCLKIEYRTETTMTVFPPEEEMEPPGESVTTLWLAPNVGIVKYHQEAEDIFLKVIPDPEFPSSTTVKTLELKKYEIKSVDSEADGSD
ncbi:hypothetical protein F4009_10590 [Candidatus Poribacteria bacterium]|nr:hypothetical protein [Candidatus Poribacteria bacterium]MYH83254.1 hypothetical protein [Candidatus Poribacteria bacterium]MYK94420.1 hypothetical protein [Candidatus Poribacteria bacterium]